MSNPIQYTSRTYQTILSDINSDDDLRDKPEWWKRIWAGVGDVLSVYLNAQANNSYLRTAFTRQAVADLSELIDYALSPRSTASGTVVFNLKSDTTFPFTFAQVDQVAATAGSITQSAKRFEGRSPIIVSSQVTGNFTADAGTDLLTVSRAFLTGEKVRFTTSGTLPDGLLPGTDYWIIAVSDTTVRVASSLANAKSGTYINIIDAGSGTHTWNLFSIQVSVYQQTSVEQYIAGTADGTEEWQEIDLADDKILKDTLSVTINSIPWSVLGVGATPSSFVFAGPTDRYVQLVYNTDETAKLRFGNGTYGEIPGGYDVYVEYATGGGVESNVSAGKIVNYAGSEVQIESVYNPASLTGGAAPETLDNAKILAPLLLKTRDRFVTVGDGKALVLNYGGVTNTKINKNVYGVLSCQVLAIANGGGNISPSEQAALQTYLIDRTILESIDVRVEDATITAQNVTAAIKVLETYSYSDIEAYVDLAFKLFFSETGKEIQDDFEANGVASATVLINSIFSTAFTSVDYGQISRLVENLTPRGFGDTIQESDALGYVDSYVNGVDYLTISAPSFPVALGDDEISTDGTISLTEIP